MKGAQSDTVLLPQRVWLCTTVDFQKFNKGSVIHQQYNRKDSFSATMTSLTLIFSTWEEMKKDGRWCLSSVAADYLISMSNWPESCCFCFSSAELTYLNLSSVHKSIWGFVFIFVSWEYSSKYNRLIHTNVAQTWLITEAIWFYSLIRTILYYLYIGNNNIVNIKNEFLNVTMNNYEYDF